MVVAEFLHSLVNNKTFGVMRRFVMIFALVGGVMLTSCSSLFTTSSFGSNDLYRTDNRVVVANRIKAEAEAQRAEAEAREAQWAARQAELEAERAEAEYYASLAEPSYQTIVANDYESAYARRLYGFNSDSYRLPSSYYSLSYNRAMQYATAYDPALYNIMVSGDQVWVEPKFITSMFGSWGATNVTFGIYSSPWTYGWGYRVDPFYYSCWGYPRYSWYDWNWTMCYNPWYYDSCYWLHYHNHYYPHYHNHYHPHKPVAPRPPQHRPNNPHNNRPDNNRPNHGFVSTGSGASSGPISGNVNVGRENSGSRYTSPTSNKNFGATTVTRPTSGRGSVSTGVNSDSKYRENNSSTTVDRGTSSSNTTANSGVVSNVKVNTGTTTKVNTGTTTGSVNTNTNKSTGNFRQSTSTTTKTTTTTNNSTTTSANKVRTTSSSNSSKNTVSKGTSTSSSRGTSSSSKVSSGTSSSNRSYGTSSTTSRSTIGSSSGTRSTGSSSGSSSSGSRGGSTSSRR